MTAPISLNRRRWLDLCTQAESAAQIRLPNAAADQLPIAAGRLTTVTPPVNGMAVTAMFTSFRWDCTAFGMALPNVRRVLADGLIRKAAVIRALIDDLDPAPVAVAMEVPEAEPPAWTQRADIGG